MTDGLWGALISGAVALLLWFLQSRNQRRSLHDAWQQQAEELRNELRESHQETVNFLQGQLMAKDVANAQLVAELGRRPKAPGDADD